MPQTFLRFIYNIHYYSLVKCAQYEWDAENFNKKSVDFVAR